MRGEKVVGISYWDKYGIHSPCNPKCPNRRYDCHFAGHCTEWDKYIKKRNDFINSDEYKQELIRRGIN